MNTLNTIGKSLLCLFLSAASVNAAGGSDSATPRDSVANTSWQNISDEFFKKLDVYDMMPAYTRRCVGMAVTPTGDVFVLTSKNNGVSVSRDHGMTWSVAAGNKVTGRCETGFGFSIAYPYDGRLAFFCIDGTGGITLDGGTTWRPFGKLLRMFEFADVDWSSRDPQAIFGLLHEPYYTALSEDGGRSWQQIDKDAQTPKEAQKSVSKYLLGLVDSNTLVRSDRDKGGIAMSTDAGKTWTDVANYKVLGRRPVHYGNKVFWTTADGVVVTTNGKDWTLTGKGPERAVYGPYFGATDQEFLVVSDKAFFLTHDGGKTWEQAASVFIPPDGAMKGFNPGGSFNYFGWDPKGNYLYASGLGGSVYQLKLKP